MLGEKLLLNFFLDHVRTEYGEIVNYSEIPNGKDEIDDVWNKSNNEKVSDKKHGKYHNFLLTDNDRSLIISRKISRNLKESFPNHKQKHNLSIKLWHEVNTKKLEYFLVDKKQ